MTTTCRLIYRSVAFESSLTNEVLASIEQKSIANNTRNDITGILALSGDRFLQVLEGESSKVNHLYNKIVQDERHHDVELLSFEQISERFFSDWAMRLVDLYDLPLQPRQFMMKKYDCKDDVVIIPRQLNLVYSFLLDARTFCLSDPWKS